MKKEFKKAIEEYQCSGCIGGYNTSCFTPNPNGGVGCGGHHAGTIIGGIGSIFLGLPKGFNRLGEFSKMKPYVFESFEKFQSEWGNYNKFNIPIWKHLTKEGHLLVRGLHPRRNEPFIHIFLDNCLDKIECLEISENDIDEMD